MRSQYRYKEEDPHYRGEEIEEQYGDGPDQNRKCTDILCLVLFLVFIGVMVYISIVAFTTGNPKYLAYPFDSEGKQCHM